MKKVILILAVLALLAMVHGTMARLTHFALGFFSSMTVTHQTTEPDEWQLKPAHFHHPKALRRPACFLTFLRLSCTCTSSSVQCCGRDGFASKGGALALLWSVREWLRPDSASSASSGCYYGSFRRQLSFESRTQWQCKNWGQGWGGGQVQARSRGRNWVLIEGPGGLMPKSPVGCLLPCVKAVSLFLLFITILPVTGKWSFFQINSLRRM